MFSVVVRAGLLAAAGLALMVAAACGGASSSPPDASSVTPDMNSPTPTGCSNEDATSLKASVHPLITRFDDANHLASSTSRIALSGVMTEMQATRRDLEALDMPACASLAKTQLVEFMNDDIDGYLSFMAQDADSIVQSKFSTALTAETQAVASWAAIFALANQ
jgi:hypothetical protein